MAAQVVDKDVQNKNTHHADTCDRGIKHMGAQDENTHGRNQHDEEIQDKSAHAKHKDTHGKEVESGNEEDPNPLAGLSAWSSSKLIRKMVVLRESDCELPFSHLSTYRFSSHASERLATNIYPTASHFPYRVPSRPRQICPPAPSRQGR